MSIFSRISALTLGLLLAPLAAQAADDEYEPAPVVTIPPGDDVIRTLRKGEEAPFNGQLFDTDTAMRWGFWLQQYDLRLVEDVRAEKKKCKVRLEYDAKVLKIEKELRETLISDLRTRLTNSETARMQTEENMRNPSFFRSLEFGLILGVVVTAGGAVAIAVASK